MAGFAAAHPEVAEPATELPMARWRRWLIMFILLTGGIKTTLAFTTVVPALQLISEYFSGASDSVLSAQMLVTLAPAGMAVGGLLAGWVVGQGGLRRTLYISLSVCSVAGLAQLFVESWSVLLASRFLLGFAVVTSDVAMTSILAAQFTGKTRSRIIGFRQAISSAGTVSTMLIAGYLAQAYGWRAPSWLFLVPVVMLVLALIAFDRPIVLSKQTTEKEQFSVLQLWPLFVLSLIMSVAHTMPSFQMPFLLKADGIDSAVLVSRVPALSALISILSAMAFGWIYMRCGRFTLIAAGCFMAVGFLGVSHAPTYEFILMCVVVEGIGAGWTMPYFQARLLDRVTPAQRSQAIGFLTTSLFLGHFVNPLITAPVRNALGIHATFTAVAIALLVLCAGLAVRARATRGQATII